MLLQAARTRQAMQDKARVSTALAQWRRSLAKGKGVGVDREAAMARDYPSACDVAAVEIYQLAELARIANGPIALADWPR
jgi:hypothetical protein